MTIEYLDVDDLLGLTVVLMGEPPPVRDVGLLGSAAARPQTTAFGEDAYPDLWIKAAALLQSIVKNDPLIDGNKRLGWVACAAFLEINGTDATRASNDGVYDLVIEVASTKTEVEASAARLRALVQAS